LGYKRGWKVGRKKGDRGYEGERGAKGEGIGE